MAKFTVEVELDWVDGEEGIEVDEEIKDQVIRGVKDQLLKKATDGAMKQLDDAIAEKIQQSQETIQAHVDEFVKTVCAGKLDSIKIPYKEDSWDAKVKYISMSKFVGMRYEAFLNKKQFNKDGHLDNYHDDYSLNDIIMNNFLRQELSSKVSDMIQKAKEESEKSVLDTIEQNLKEQLATDTIKRLNIPQLLKNLQDTADKIEQKN